MTTRELRGELCKELTRLGLINELSVEVQDCTALITYGDEIFSLLYIDDTLEDIRKMESGSEFISFLMDEGLKGDIRQDCNIYG